MASSEKPSLRRLRMYCLISSLITAVPGRISLNILPLQHGSLPLLDLGCHPEVVGAEVVRQHLFRRGPVRLSCGKADEPDVKVRTYLHEILALPVGHVGHLFCDDDHGLDVGCAVGVGASLRYGWNSF